MPASGMIRASTAASVYPLIPVQFASVETSSTMASIQCKCKSNLTPSRRSCVVNVKEFTRVASVIERECVGVSGVVGGWPKDTYVCICVASNTL